MKFKDLKVGDTVYHVYYPSVGGPFTFGFSASRPDKYEGVFAIAVKVERVTKTQAMANGARFRLSDGASMCQKGDSAYSVGDELFMYGRKTIERCELAEYKKYKAELDEISRASSMLERRCECDFFSLSKDDALKAARLINSAFDIIGTHKNQDRG